MINSKKVPKLRFPEFSDEWEEKKLETSVTIDNGAPFQSKYFNNEGSGKPLIRIRDLKAKKLTTYYSGEFDEKYIVSNGDILVGMDGEFNLVKWDLGYALLNQRVMKICAKPGNNKDFLAYLINTKLTDIERKTPQTTVKHLSNKDIKQIITPLPSIDEQEKIADFLQLFDEKIAGLQRKKELLETYKKGMMQKIFSQEIRFKDKDDQNYPSWQSKKLKAICDNFMVPMRDKPKNLNGPTPWCRIEDFDGKYLTSSKSGQGVNQEEIKRLGLTVFPKNTLIVSCSANLGECAIAGIDLVTNQTFIGLSVKNENSLDFMYHLMRHSKHRLNTLSSGTTISYLSREGFEKLIVEIPTIDEQMKIADFLTSIDEKIEAEERKLEQAKQFKKALLQQMFV